MTPEQIEMCSLKASIEHIVSTYITLYDDVTVFNKTSELLKDLYDSKKLAAYQVFIQKENNGIDINYKLPSGHGGLLTLLFNKYRKPVYSFASIIAPHENVLSQFLLNKIPLDKNIQDILSNSSIFIHTDSKTISQTLQTTAIWYMFPGPHSQNVEYIVPLQSSVKKTIDTLIELLKSVDLHGIVQGSVISCNGSTITVRSLSQLTPTLDVQYVRIIDICDGFEDSNGISGYAALTNVMFDNFNVLLNDCRPGTILSCNNWLALNTMLKKYKDSSDHSLGITFGDTGVAVFNINCGDKY